MSADKSITLTAKATWSVLKLRMRRQNSFSVAPSDFWMESDSKCIFQQCTAESGAFKATLCNLRITASE